MGTSLLQRLQVRVDVVHVRVGVLAELIDVRLQRIVAADRTAPPATIASTRRHPSP